MADGTTKIVKKKVLNAEGQRKMMNNKSSSKFT